MSLNSALRSLCGFFLLVFCGVSAAAQDTTGAKKEQSTPALEYFPASPNAYEFKYPFNKQKVRGIAIKNVVGYSAVMVGLYTAWYKDYPQSKFHVFNDNAEWLQIDKIGHAYSAYAESRVSMEFWRRTGISRNKRILLGGLSGAAYQTVVETLDGFSSEWGWSWGDFAANVTGSGLLTLQELAWNEQRIQFKLSFHRKSYDDPQLNARSDELFGKSAPERFLKDYNGQTYWLSANIKSFFPQSRVPGWLMVSVGTGAEGLFGARSNVSTKDELMRFSRTDIPRYRQWYLAPDIDFTKIRTRKKALKTILNILSIIKVPAPSLEYSKKGFSINFLHF